MQHIERHLARIRLEGLAPGTIYARRRALARLAAALPVPLPGATPDMLLAWRESLTVSAGAVANYTRHVQRFYAWAADEGLISENPAAAIPVPRAARGVPRPITETDLMAALDAAPERIRLWLVLAAWCGLRACEIAYLRAESIALHAARPAIWIRADATKGLTEHVVPLCSFACAEIAAAGLPPAGWAFRRRDGRRGPNTPALVSHLANGHLHACGIASTLHKLRHRFATELYEASGHDLLAVRDALGHRSIQSTTVYTLVNPAAADAVEKIPSPRRLRAAG